MYSGSERTRRLSRDNRTHPTRNTYITRPLRGATDITEGGRDVNENVASPRVCTLCAPTHRAFGFAFHDRAAHSTKMQNAKETTVKLKRERYDAVAGRVRCWWRRSRDIAHSAETRRAARPLPCHIRAERAPQRASTSLYTVFSSHLNVKDRLRLDGAHCRASLAAEKSIEVPHRRQ